MVGLSWLELQGIGGDFPLITQRSLVQIQPPQPIKFIDIKRLGRSRLLSLFPSRVVRPHALEQFGTAALYRKSYRDQIRPNPEAPRFQGKTKVSDYPVSLLFSALPR